MKRVEAVFRPERLEHVAAALDGAGFHGFTITDARGHGRSAERTGEWRGVPFDMLVTHKLAIAVITEDGEVDAVVGAIARGASTGEVGDGLITVSDLVGVYSIRAHSPVATRTVTADGPTTATTTATPSRGHRTAGRTAG
ncbi:MAG: P-II family nitrogen regulator, partial [Acidimicrobiales bacterium]